MSSEYHFRNCLHHTSVILPPFNWISNSIANLLRSEILIFPRSNSHGLLQLSHLNREWYQRRLGGKGVLFLLLLFCWLPIVLICIPFAYNLIKSVEFELLSRSGKRWRSAGWPWPWPGWPWPRSGVKRSSKEIASRRAASSAPFWERSSPLPSQQPSCRLSCSPSISGVWPIKVRFQIIYAPPLSIPSLSRIHPHFNPLILIRLFQSAHFNPPISIRPFQSARFNPPVSIRSFHSVHLPSLTRSKAPITETFTCVQPSR